MIFIDTKLKNMVLGNSYCFLSMITYFTAFVVSGGGVILVQGARVIKIKTDCNVQDFVAKMTISRTFVTVFNRRVLSTLLKC